MTTRNEKETEYLGVVLAGLMEQPMVIALNGELGTGKTVLVRGAARGLGVMEPVTSPTFVLLRIYRGKMPLHHFDFYRLEEPEELEPLGFEEYLPGGGAAFVEWAEKFPEVLPGEHLEIQLERFFDHSGEGRRFLMKPYGETASLVVEQLIETITWRVDGTLNMPAPAAEEKPAAPAPPCES